MQELMPEPEIWNIFIQSVKGLKALHDLNIFHRDLKSANVFLSKDGLVKLGDFNVSKLAKKGLLYTQTGTPYYARYLFTNINYNLSCLSVFLFDKKLLKSLIIKVQRSGKISLTIRLVIFGHLDA
jgi:serine/threonine protein kinase